MDFFQAMESRMSCRSFKERTVDRQTLERLLRAANQSPSYMNTQPWEVFVAAGERKKALSRKLYEAITSAAPMQPYIPFQRQWPEPIELRALTHRNSRFRALGIDPEKDQDKVRESYLRNFLFFDAPCALFIGMDGSLPAWSIFDLGLFTHGLLLAAHASGLGACPQAMPTAYPELIRDVLGIPENIAIVLTISLGYPDSEAPVNRYRSVRRGIGEFVHWIGC